MDILLTQTYILWGKCTYIKLIMLKLKLKLVYTFLVMLCDVQRIYSSSLILLMNKTKPTQRKTSFT